MTVLDLNAKIDAKIEASIERKIEAALARGLDLAALTNPKDDAAAKHSALAWGLGITPQEQDWLVKQQVRRLVQIEVGRLITSGEDIKIDPRERAECLAVFAEALAAGEVDAA